MKTVTAPDYWLKGWKKAQVNYDISPSLRDKERNNLHRQPHSLTKANNKGKDKKCLIIRPQLILADALIMLTLKVKKIIYIETQVN